ncbi:MAG: ComF family protein [Planctomycetales bacterium]|nr:ComF family protein [Planctomycetales bacterium]
MKWKFQRTIALGPYRGQLREAVILMKKSGAETLRNALGRLLGKQLRDLVNSRTTAEPRHVPDPILVPVPNHWTHGLSRAANTAGSIAAAVASETGYPVADRAIRRIRKTSKQGMLAWTERAKNVRHAFQISNAKLLIERHVILVDDVLTSGATVGELARVLHRVGISSLDVAVVARGTGSRESSPATARPDHAG